MGEPPGGKSNKPQERGGGRKVDRLGKEVKKNALGIGKDISYTELRFSQKIY